MEYPPLPHPDDPLPVYDQLFIEHQEWLQNRAFGQADEAAEYTVDLKKAEAA